MYGRTARGEIHKVTLSDIQRQVNKMYDRYAAKFLKEYSDKNNANGTINGFDDFDRISLWARPAPGFWNVYPVKVSKSRCRPARPLKMKGFVSRSHRELKDELWVALCSFG